MGRKALITIVIAVIAILLIGGGVIWDLQVGPDRLTRLPLIDKQLSASAESYRKAAAVQAKCRTSYEKWKTRDLSVDKQMENVKVRAQAGDKFLGEESLEGGLQQTSAEIDALLKDIKQARSDLAESDRRVARLQKIELPQHYVGYVHAAGQRNDDARSGLNSLETGLKELKKDIVACGLYGLTVADCNVLMSQVKGVKASLDAQSYVQADTQMPDVDITLSDTASWVGMGDLALIDEDGSGQDAHTLLEFVSKARVATATLDRMTDAGVSGDLQEVSASEPHASQEIADLADFATLIGIDGTFKSWFLKSADNHLTGAEKKFKNARQIDKKANAT